MTELTKDEKLALLQRLEAAQGYLGLGMAMDAWNELESIDARHRHLAEVLKVRAEVCRALEKWELMAELCRFLARGEPDDAGHPLNLAYAVRRHESVEAAAEILADALGRFPAEALIPYNLACYRAVAGKIGEAKDLLERAFNLDKSLRVTALDDPDLEAVR